VITLHFLFDADIQFLPLNYVVENANIMVKWTKILVDTQDQSYDILLYTYKLNGIRITYQHARTLRNES